MWFFILFLDIQSSSAQVLLPALQIQEDLNSKYGNSQQVHRADARNLSGKKTKEIKIENDLPPVLENSPRQVLSGIPGLNVSEVQNKSISSLSFRGLGDPHETFFIQTLEDGMPIAADPYGYAANYYAPPFQVLDSVEFFKNGGSLLYGPQPGGALNYRTRDLTPGTKLGIRTQQVLGSYGLWNSVNEIEKGIGERQAVRLTYVRRSSDGFRDANQDSVGDYIQAKYVNLIGSTLFTAKADYSQSDFGEPGGLARTSSGNTIGADQSWTAVTTPNDRLIIDRQSLFLSADTEFNSKTRWISKIQATDYGRLSRRQAQGTAPVFGGVVNGTTNTIQDQQFVNVAFDSRASFEADLNAFKVQPVLGATGFVSNSEFSQSTGSAPNAEQGARNRFIKRQSQSYSVFAENTLDFGQFRATPGIRLENNRQAIQELQNQSSPTNLRNANETVWVPLLGMGLEWDHAPKAQTYFNLSEGYRPVMFADAVPLTTGASISSDLLPGNSWTSELGVRSRNIENFNVDLSGFFIRYENQFGRVGNVIQNTGAGRHFGADLAVDWTFGRFKIKNAITYLNARYTRGSLETKTPMYAPRFYGQAGLEFRATRKWTWAAQNTFSSQQFGDDGNSGNLVIPGFSVTDLSTQYEILQDRLTAQLMLQNLFDRKYFSRIRANGMDPVQPFSVQGGIKYVL